MDMHQILAVFTNLQNNNMSGTPNDSIIEDKESCSLCNGRKKHDCSWCGGNGYHDDWEHTECAHCDGTGEVDCDRCNDTVNETNAKEDISMSENIISTRTKQFNSGLSEDKMETNGKTYPSGRTHRAPVKNPGVKDLNSSKVKAISDEFFGQKPYSVNRIGEGGNIRRFSYNCGIKGYSFRNSGRIDNETITSLPKAPDEVKAKLLHIREVLLKKFQEAGVPKDATDVKFHIGSGLYASVRVKLGINSSKEDGESSKAIKPADKAIKSTSNTDSQEDVSNSNVVGKGIYESKVCHNCSADGIVACDLCEGKTGIKECPNCHGQGEVVCSKCKGRGAIELKESCGEKSMRTLLESIGDGQLDNFNSDESSEYSTESTPESKVLISSVYNTDGSMSGVNIEANSTDAAELLSILTLSGLPKSNEEVSSTIEPEMKSLPAEATFADSKEVESDPNMEDEIGPEEESLDSDPWGIDENTSSVDELYVDEIQINEEYVIKVGDNYALTIPSIHDELLLTPDIKQAKKYRSTETANHFAIMAKGQTGKPVAVKLAESLTPVRKSEGINNASKAWANEPNEQIAGWRALVDDSDGLSQPHDQFKNYRGGDNNMKVAKNKKEDMESDQPLHEDIAINAVAEKLSEKFKNLDENDAKFATRKLDAVNIDHKLQSLGFFRDINAEEDCDHTAKIWTKENNSGTVNDTETISIAHGWEWFYRAPTGEEHDGLGRGSLLQLLDSMTNLSEPVDTPMNFPLDGPSAPVNESIRQVFIVQVPANVYDGKYYDFRTIDVRVYKGEDGVETPYDAADWVNSHKEEVLAQLDKKRWRVGNTTPRNIYAVKHPVEKNVFFGMGVSYRVRESSVQTMDKPSVNESTIKNSSKKEGTCETKGCFAKAIHNRGFGKGKPSNTCDKCFNKLIKEKNKKVNEWKACNPHSIEDKKLNDKEKAKDKKTVKKVTENISELSNRSDFQYEGDDAPYYAEFKELSKGQNPGARKQIVADNPASAIEKAKLWCDYLNQRPGTIKNGLKFELSYVYDMHREKTHHPFEIYPTEHSFFKECPYCHGEGCDKCENGSVWDSETYPLSSEVKKKLLNRV